MKKLLLISLSALFILCLATSCDHLPDTSKEEALYLIKGQSDFQELIQYFSLTSERVSPFIYERVPELRWTVYAEDKKMATGHFSHVAIYRTKQQSFKLVILNSDRPVGIVAIQEFK